jgi:methylated-DNA-[protein]-cysteine S-methyltransferase
MNAATTHPDRTDRLATAVVESPIGGLRLVASDVGLREILFADASGAAAPAPAGAAPVGAGEHPVLARAARELAEYFAGTRDAFTVALDARGTAFQRAAWDVLSRIPYGETITYGEQARRLGDPRKARAVGAANGRNPLPIVVPCHRVVGADGSLTGFAAGVETKRWLLRHENRRARRSFDQ